MYTCTYNSHCTVKQFKCAGSGLLFTFFLYSDGCCYHSSPFYMKGCYTIWQSWENTSNLLFPAIAQTKRILVWVTTWNLFENIVSQWLLINCVVRKKGLCGRLCLFMKNDPVLEGYLLQTDPEVSTKWTSRLAKKMHSFSTTEQHTFLAVFSK